METFIIRVLYYFDKHPLIPRIFVFFFASIALLLTSALVFSLFRDFVDPSALTKVATYIFTVTVIVWFGLVVWSVRAPVRKKTDYNDAKTISVSESISAVERQVATKSAVMVREFQARIEKEMNSAVTRVMEQSNEIIRNKLSERVDGTIGKDLVSILGTKLASQTDEQNRKAILNQKASDRFELMQSRSLQYAEAANEQADRFRLIGVRLAIGGLIALGLVLGATQIQFLYKPDMIEKHIEWSTFMVRNGPTYGFVVLCEALALIMFRYQSKSLEFMRYFSNEATNLDARHIAYLSGLQMLDKKEFAALVLKLEMTERNKELKKGERTVEIANNESEDKVTMHMTDFLRSVASGGDRNRHESEEPEKPNSKSKRGKANGKGATTGAG